MTPRIQPPRLQPAGLLPVPVTVYGRERGEPWFELGFPGLDPVRPSLDILCFDHSGSVVAPGGTDPIGRRFLEAKQAIRIVQAWTYTSRPKVAVIHFDQPSAGNSGAVPLNSTHAGRQLAAALKVPIDAAGSSNLAPSLTVAEELAKAHPDHDVRFTILSDFQITDLDPENVFKRLADFPGQVHAVLLNAPAPPDLAGENITITEIAHGDAPGALSAAIHRSLTATRRGRRLSVLHADRTRPSIPPLSPEHSRKGNR